MTLVTTIAGTNFAATATRRTERLISAANRANLVGEYLFGRDAATSRFNLTGGANLSFNGTPTFAARAAQFSQNNWADTGLPDSQELTLLIVSAMVGANTYPLVTNFNGSNATDTTTFNVTSAAGQITGISAASDNTQVSPPNLNGRMPTTEYTIKTLRTTGSANFTIKIDEFRGGIRIGGQSLVSTKTRKVTTSAPFAIGSSRGAASFAGTSSVAGAAIWTRALSDAEILAESAAISALMAAWPQQSITT